MKLSPGKRKRLESVSDSRGVIAALAIDQRDALRKLFSAELKMEKHAVPRELLEEFKSTVVRALSPHSSAVLLEPEYGLRAASQRSPSSGLLMAYEVSGYDPNVPGRAPRLLEGWSVRRLADAGAHCIKVLLYYALLDAPEIMERKRAWVERVGWECAGCDVPFFLEIVPYQDGVNEQSPEFARCKPDILTNAMKQFSQPRYCVDVLKVGVPVTMAYVQGSSACKGTFIHSRPDALALFRRAAEAAAKPFLFLSAGVSNRVFNEALELASEAGIHFCGVLCGRATWKDGVSVFVRGGPEALQKWLETDGMKNIQAVNASLRNATPWSKQYPANE
ncbi:MAG: tagatose 1,6-diphosphate aldolase [Acidobacteria bacterium]|nr:MAG: tagatose 1,6-diphosphate aldolase [Acidobacteriota bacterium]